jgi:natural product precursor
MKRIGRLNLRDLSGKRLQRPEMKFLVGGYGDEGGYDGYSGITCEACDNACHCITLPCQCSTLSECMDWIMGEIPAATGWTCTN